MPEPRDPLLKVLTYLVIDSEFQYQTEFSGPPTGLPRSYRVGAPVREHQNREGCETCRSNNRYVHMGLGVYNNSIMIPPLVHQRRPCYDFYFL